MALRISAEMAGNIEDNISPSGRPCRKASRGERLGGCPCYGIRPNPLYGSQMPSAQLLAYLLKCSAPR
jgi:hypothetical protein